jgi:RimJ/RimL family protein N-acetyltransferase
MAELPILKGNGLLLRAWRREDVTDLHREIQDPEIIRWLDIGLPYAIADAEKFIASCAGHWGDRTAAHFAITELDGTFLGYLGVLSAEDHMRIVEIVYWVAASARGTATARRAVLTVLTWVKETVAPERIELGMLEGNTGSARTAESAGFVLREVRDAPKPGGGQPGKERIYELAWDAVAG